MAKVARKKTKKVARKKVTKKKVTRKKVVRKKTTRKKVVRKKTPAKRKKTVRRKKAVKKTAISRDTTALKKMLKDILGLVGTIKKKETAIQKEIDKNHKKMFSTRDESKKLQYFFRMESLKIEAFNKLEKEYKALSPLLNKAFKHASRVGGIVRDDFLNICEDLSKGINIPVLERDFKKMYKDL